MDTNRSKWNVPEPSQGLSEFDVRGFLADDAPHFPLFPRESTLVETFRVLKKRKWMIICTLVVSMTLGTLLSLRTTPKYDATARILFAKESGESLGLKDVQTNSEPDDFDYTVSMDTQTRVLQSDRLALEVIKNLHLDERAAFAGSLVAKPKNESIPGRQIDHSREAALLGAFHAAMRINTIRNTRILEITFRSSDPTLAAEIANTVVSTYIEDNYRTRYESTMQASDWLAKQISDLKQRVQTSEEKMLRYQRDNGMLGIDDKQNIVTQRLDDLNKDLTEAQADRIAKQAAYESARDGKLDQIPDAGNGLGSNLRTQLATLRSQYAQLTTSFGPNYPKASELRNQISEIEHAIQAEDHRQLTFLLSTYAAAQSREAMLEKALDRQKIDANQLNEKAIEYSILKRDLDANRTLYESLLQRLKEAGVAAGLRSSNIRIVDNARVPTVPAVPNVPRNLEFSFLGGLVGSILLALLIEGLDTTVATPAEAQEVIGLPSFGVIPHSSSLRATALSRTLKSLTVTDTARTHSALIAQSSPSSEMAESFRSLRTSILLSSAVKRPAVLLFTSTMPREGKTTTCVNMSIVLAQRGGRVLLVDTDLRRPGVHQCFGLSNNMGLSSVLAGLESFEDVIQRHGSVPNLDIVTAGPVPPQPAELLGSERMQEFLKRARLEYDHVILDSSPVNLVTDPAVLSPYTDVVLLVVRAGAASKNSLRHARDQLLHINAPLAGIVVNDAKLDSFDYHYRSYYGKKTKSRYSSEDTHDMAS